MYSKDGTEDTVDYRFLSVFFLILRIAHGGKSIVITLLKGTYAYTSNFGNHSSFNGCIVFHIKAIQESLEK